VTTDPEQPFLSCALQLAVSDEISVKVPLTPAAEILVAVLLPEPEAVCCVVDDPLGAAVTVTVCVRVDVTLMVASVSTPSVELNSLIVVEPVSVLLADPVASPSVTLPLMLKVDGDVVTVSAAAGAAITVPRAAATAAARAVGLGVVTMWRMSVKRLGLLADQQRWLNHLASRVPIKTCF
jgi:hypothetical protein